MNEKTKTNLLTRATLDDDEYRAGQIAALAIVLGDVMMLLEGLDEIQSLDGLLSSTEKAIKENQDEIDRERMAGAISIIEALAMRTQ